NPAPSEKPKQRQPVFLWVSCLVQVQGFKNLLKFFGGEGFPVCPVFVLVEYLVSTGRNRYILGKSPQRLGELKQGIQSPQILSLDGLGWFAVCKQVVNVGGDVVIDDVPDRVRVCLLPDGNPPTEMLVIVAILVE